MNANDRAQLKLYGMALGGLAGGWLVFQFYRSGVPSNSGGAAWQNQPAFRFWVAVWSTFYRLDPKTVQAIAYQEQGPAGQSTDGWNVAEPNGTTSWGPLHVNDLNLSAVGYSTGPAGTDTMRGLQLGCRWLRHEIDAHGGDESAAIASWNPGQGDYLARVEGFKSTYV